MSPKFLNMDQGSFAYKMVVFRINNTDIFMQLILVYFPTFSRFLLAKSYKLIKFKSRGQLQGNKLIPRRRAIRISDNLGNSVLCSRLDSNNFAADPPPHPSTLGMGSMGQNSTFFRTWSCCISNLSESPNVAAW